MEMTALRQPPYETTFVGVLKGVLDHFGRPTSDAMVFGGSAHAFVINVHEALCPSSPYVWNLEALDPCLRNLGVRMAALGFFHAGSSPEERAAIEGALRGRLDDDQPCSLCNTDHQLIRGYDETGFALARPWPGNPDYPPGSLTYGQWPELGPEPHVSFFAFERVEPAPVLTTFRDSLAAAVELHRRPEPHQCEHYAMGPGAYDHWAAAAEAHGAAHGNWWNGTVWSECRGAAAGYFDEMAPSLDGEAADAAREIATRYREIAAGLGRLADKELPPDAKAALAHELKGREAEAIAAVEALLVRLG